MFNKWLSGGLLLPEGFTTNTNNKRFIINSTKDNKFNSKIGNHLGYLQQTQV